MVLGIFLSIVVVVICLATFISGFAVLAGTTQRDSIELKIALVVIMLIPTITAILSGLMGVQATHNRYAVNKVEFVNVGDCVNNVINDRVVFTFCGADDE